MLLRAAEPRSSAAIDEQIGPVLDTITLQEARGWFRYCGYPCQTDPKTALKSILNYPH